MATMPTAEKSARLILKMYKHFGSCPGECLRMNNFVTLAVERGLRIADLQEGLKYGGEKGWFEDGPNGFVRLTEGGVKNIAASPFAFGHTRC